MRERKHDFIEKRTIRCRERSLVDGFRHFTRPGGNRINTGQLATAREPRPRAHTHTHTRGQLASQHAQRAKAKATFDAHLPILASATICEARVSAAMSS